MKKHSIGTQNSSFCSVLTKLRTGGNEMTDEQKELFDNLPNNIKEKIFEQCIILSDKKFGNKLVEYVLTKFKDYYMKIGDKLFRYCMIPIIF